MAPDPPNRRRADLQAALALVMLGLALSALGAVALGPAKASAPPSLPAAPAVYRPDGGQALGPGGRLRPNELTGLNLGRQIKLDQARPEHLALLPGLGPKSAPAARERGCLTNSQRRNLTGLVFEPCTPTKP